ncbi:5-hydroxytryptamine (serotonin) receptor 4, G protein-coupled [Chamberlinius hualienensis]
MAMVTNQSGWQQHFFVTELSVDMTNSFDWISDFPIYINASSATPWSRNQNDSVNESTDSMDLLRPHVNNISLQIYPESVYVPQEDLITSYSYRILGSIFCGLLILVTVIGNVMLVLAVFIFRRLRSVTNMLMASLAVADITVAILVMPYLLIYDLIRSWNFGPIFCHIWISCDVMCCTASILHLCIIALDRFMAITNPLRYKILMSRRRGIYLIVSAWICSAAISFVPIMLGWYSDGSMADLYTVSEHCTLNVNKVYAVVSSATSFYLPSPIMFYIYTKIFVIAQRQSREIKRMERTIHHSSKLEQRRFKRHSKRVHSDTKAIKTLGIIMGAFCFCWLPFFLMYLILPFCSSPACNLPYEIRSGITWLGYINSFINPCIYGLINNEFRSAFLRTLRCEFNNNSDNSSNRYRSDSHSGSSINRSLHSISSLELDSMNSSKGRGNPV